MFVHEAEVEDIEAELLKGKAVTGGTPFAVDLLVATSHVFRKVGASALRLT